MHHYVSLRIMYEHNFCTTETKKRKTNTHVHIYVIQANCTYIYNQILFKTKTDIR